MKNQKILVLAFIFVMSITKIFAAPYHGEPYEVNQPDGSHVIVYLYGDEYYIRAETSDGYTVIRDEATGWICYATLSEDKTKLVSTGIPYKGESIKNNQRVSDVPFDKHLDITNDARQNIAKSNRQKLHGINEVPSSHTNDKNVTIENAPAPLLKTKETIKGLTILVDFSDAPATVSKAEINDFLNGNNYTGYGNNGSMKEYYEEISNGLLVYENVVFGYFRAPKSFSEYDAMKYPEGTREILRLALKWVDDQGFDFSTLTASNRNIQAINLIHTGVPQNWSQGMWYHQGSYSGFFADGVRVRQYNSSPANAPLYIGAVVHENGHMIGDWPDTYKYNKNNGPDGIGLFDVMCNAYGGEGYNPTPPNPYFLSTRGWANMIDITNVNTSIQDSSNTNTIYKYSKSSTEYYLIKARQKVGRSSDIPDEGLTIWHIDENGDNQTNHHQVFLEHANNDILNHLGACWKKGGNESFNDNTIPSARWYDNTISNLQIWNIGTPGNVMTYNIGNAPIDCNGDEGGLAFIDDCNVCAGGNTGIKPNSSCVFYCDAIGNAGTGSDYINFVSYGNVTNTTKKDYYSDFTNLNHSFAPCTKIGVTVKLNWAFAADFVYAWVDWNRDGIFEDKERTNFPAFTNNTTFAQITVPTDVEGNFRMRIRNIYHFTSPPIGDPCGDYAGEVEDYSITIDKSCNDCNGDAGGTAFMDKCNECVGGNTGKNECVISSLQDIHKTNDTKIYPNPTENNITLELSPSSIECSIMISNTLGEEVFKVKNNKDNIVSLPTGTFENGIYFLKIETQNKIETFKFIKK